MSNYDIEFKKKYDLNRQDYDFPKKTYFKESCKIFKNLETILINVHI